LFKIKPLTFKTLQLFNCYSVLSHIQPLHHIVDNPLFAALFDLLCVLAYFRHADHRVEGEPVENFQDLKFEDLEQPAGFEDKCP
jgi:hypothetical protein